MIKLKSNGKEREEGTINRTAEGRKEREKTTVFTYYAMNLLWFFYFAFHVLICHLYSYYVVQSFDMRIKKENKKKREQKCRCGFVHFHLAICFIDHQPLFSVHIIIFVFFSALSFSFHFISIYVFFLFYVRRNLKMNKTLFKN